MRTRTNKAVFITEETHAKLTRLLGKEIVKNKGKRVTYDQLINNLINNHT